MAARTNRMIGRNDTDCPTVPRPGFVAGLRGALTRFQQIPAGILLGLIWLYRRTLSPALPAVFGPGCGCRFHPTCAVYAAEAVRRHGAARGAWLGLRRLLKCQPFHPGGFDPVPPPPRLRCRALPATSRVLVRAPDGRRAGCSV